MSAPFATRLPLVSPASTPLGWEELQTRLGSLQGGIDVLLVGGEPATSPHLLRVIREVRVRGAMPVLVTGGAQVGAPERIAALVSAGLAEISVRMDDPAADRGPKSPLGRALRALDAARVDSRLPRSIAVWGTPGRPEGLVRLAAEQGVRLRVLRSGDELAAPDDLEDAWLDAAWAAACAAGVELQVTGWLLPWDHAPQGPPARSAAGGLLGMVTGAFLPRSARAGVHGADPELARLLASAGAVSLDQPPCAGGLVTDAADPRPPTCAPCPAACQGAPASHPHPAWLGCPPAARVAVLVPDLEDKVQVLSTFPALASALAGRGMKTELLSAWDVQFSPTDIRAPLTWPAWQQIAWSMGRRWLGRKDPRQNYLPPRTRLGHPMRWTEPPVRARSVMRWFWDTLDLSDFQVVIVAATWSRTLLDHPTLSPDTRVILVDDHMLEGLEAVRGRWTGRAEVHACFPSYSWLYGRVGVPLDRLHWRPYPLHLRHYEPPRRPAASDTLFCGGWHHRDTPTLVAAAAHLRSRPIEVVAGAEPGLHSTGPVRVVGTTDLPGFVERIGRSRFVVLPLRYDPSRAAGITVASMAFACGRPVIATATPAMRDHVRHGVDGLLVPPSDPAALAHAIEQLDRDDALLHRLAQGAREAAMRHSVETWADHIVHGAPPVAAVRDAGWRAW